MGERVNYFAYGSNMDLQNLERLKVKVFKVEKALLNNYKLVFNVVNDYLPGAGYANIMPKPGSSVEGIIFFTDEISLKHLDEYEGYPYLYKKSYLEVFSQNNPRQKSLVYIGNPLCLKEGLLPSEDHLMHILKGKEFLGKEYWERLSQLDVISSKKIKFYK